MKKLCITLCTLFSFTSAMDHHSSEKAYRVHQREEKQTTHKRKKTKKTDSLLHTRHCCRCLECPQIFEKQQFLNQHLIRSHIQCEICGKWCLNPERLSQHSIDHEKKLHPPVIVHKPCIDLSTTYCALPMIEEEDLKDRAIETSRPWDLMSTEELQNPHAPRIPLSEKEYFQSCLGHFTITGGLTKPRSYRCRVDGCTYESTGSSNRRRHEKTHKTFTCRQCHQTFPDYSLFKKHLGEKKL